jgi:hypothetical protein
MHIVTFFRLLALVVFSVAFVDRSVAGDQAQVPRVPSRVSSVKISAVQPPEAVLRPEKFKTVAFPWLMVGGRPDDYTYPETTIGAMTFKAGATGTAVIRARGSCDMISHNTKANSMTIQVKLAKDKSFDFVNTPYYAILSIPSDSNIYGSEFYLPWTAQHVFPVVVNRVYNVVTLARIETNGPRYNYCITTMDMEIK